MTLHINQTSQFKRDIKKLRKQGKDLSDLFEVITLLAGQQPLPDKYRDHSLTSNWRAYRECHIHPDWLLIYQIDDTELYLARSGSHSELF